MAYQYVMNASLFIQHVFFNQHFHRSAESELLLVSYDTVLVTYKCTYRHALPC